MNDEDTRYVGYSGTLSRRRLLRQATAGGFALGVAAIIGCGGDDDDDGASVLPTASTIAPDPAPRATAAATAAATEQASAAAPAPTNRGGVLRYITPQGISPTNLDPYLTDKGISNLLMGKFYYESLIEVDFTNQEWRSPYNLKGHLAESWEVQPDGITYDFKIRPGVKFHNGTTLSAHDVAYSLGRAQDPASNNNAFRRSVDAPVEILDDMTVRITAKSVDVEFLEVVNGYIGQVAIQPKNFPVDSFADDVLGTGPYTISHHHPGSTALAVKFQDYWQKDMPYLDGIHFVWDAADAVMSAAFIAKDVDILVRNDGVQAKPILEANKEAESVKWPSDYIYGPYFNLNQKPLDDVRVRQALHISINREDAEAVVSFGDGVISGPMMIVRDGFTMPQSELFKRPGYRMPKDADIAEAKKLMAAAGHSDGFKIRCGFRNTFTFAEAYATSLKEQYKKHLNVDLELQPLESAVMREAQSQSGDFDILLSSISGVVRPNSAVSRWHSSHPNAVAQGINNPELDTLIDAAKIEFDPASRGEIFQKIEKVLFENMYFAGISAASLFRMWQPWVNDWRDNRARFPSIMNPAWVSLDLDKAPENRKTAPGV